MKARGEAAERLAETGEVDIDHLIAFRAGDVSIASRAIPSFIMAGGIDANDTSLTIRAAGRTVSSRINSVTRRSRRGKSQRAIPTVAMITSHSTAIT
jgi:hypothetical protein